MCPGSFGVAPSPNPFGGSAQASPVNPFQGGGGFGGSPPSGGGFGGFGGSPPSGGGFGNDSTSFGGRGGGRNSFSSRGGRTPSRGGGRSGGRSFPAYQDNTFGTPSVPFGGGRGRGGGGRGPVASGSSFDNPFASPAPSPGGFGVQPTPSGSATAFGHGGGRNGGRGGGRDGSGRGGTTFGGAAMAQPNIRRKSDAGGRGPRTPGTMFGQGAGGGAFVPPLPPSSPPPIGPTRKPGRGGIVTPSTSAFSSAAPVSTTFGQQVTARPKGRIAPTAEASQDGANPFGGAITSTSTPARTTFGVHGGPVESAPSSRAAREKSQSNAFSQQSPFQDGFEEPSPFEARMTGMKPRSSNRLQSHGDLIGEATTFGRRPRTKDTLNGTPVTFTAHSGGGEKDATSGLVPTLKTKKKTRGTPQASPPPTPAVDANGYQTIGDQRNKAELESAGNLDGLCIDMCSPASRQEGILRDDISTFEKCFPGQPGQERELIVKRFQRSSADHKLDIPSEIRPPGVLRRTQLYLEKEIMDRERLGLDPRFSPPRKPELLELYNLCWDRCRMIRKDFVLQNYRGAGGRVHPIAIDVHERIARYHIFSEHELCEVTSFVSQQNIEQLGQTLKSLNELYDESRKLSDPAYLSPFEAEFRGYFILITLDNGRGSDVLKFVKGLAPQVRETAQVKFAMQIFVARHTQNYCLFFKLFRQATYLQACLVWRYIPSMRSLALERLNRAHRNQPYPMGDLIELLCFDDFEDAQATCTQHGLDISASEESDGDGEPVVNFGGEFESDIQLRQNKNPLPIRASHVYVSHKQGDFLRGEVCRGVTEYAQEDYPALSKLIEDTENAERSAMYPDRPTYEDEFSAFATFNSDPYAVDDQSTSVRHPMPHLRITSTTDQDEQLHELDEIAKKKADVERTKARMIERIQQLEREKEEKKRLALEIEAAKRREEEAKELAKADLLRKQREAQDKLLAEEEARKQKQLELEAQERQRVLAAKAAAEEAQLAEQRRIAEAKRQAEEERRQRELQKAEDERRKKAAAEAERRRQLELAAERERLEREARRKAVLALEAARRKQVQRENKQRLAILKLRFHSWKNFVTRSKTLPRDVIVEAASLVERNTCKPHDVMEWLFGGSRSASDFIGLQRRMFDLNSLDYGIYSPPPKGFWQPLAVASIVGQQLHGAGNSSSGWKFVVADLLDDGLSSFGSWCAVKCGISASSIEDDDNVSTVHSTQWSDSHSLAVCCRYLSANFLRSLSAQGREKRLAGTSGIILPLDLSHTLDPKKLHSWEDRVRGVLSHLHPSRRVGVIVLGYCADKTPRKGDALAAAEASIQRLLLERTRQVAFIDGELVLEEDLFSADSANHKISAVISKLAGTESPQIGRLQMDLSDLMDAAVHSALQERSESVEGVAEVQDRLHKQLWQLRDTLLSPSVIDVDIPIPELQATLGAPSYGWNSRDAQQKWDAMFKTLTSHSVTAFDTPIASSKVCEVYFEQISQLVDAIFSHRISSSVVSTIELKRSIYGLLVPVYEEFLKQGEAKIQGASRLLPWRQIFEHIYSAFVESVDEELLYIPTHLVESIMRRRNVFPAKSAVKRSRRRPALDASAQAAAVAFARRELKRALSDSTLPPTEVDSIKRLRHEIARDKAATQNFQQYLRRELGRWSAADEGFPALS